MDREALLGEHLGEALLLINIDLGHFDRALGFGHGAFKHRAKGLAGATPWRPEVDDHRGLHRGFNHVFHEGGFCDVKDQIFCCGGL